MATNIEEIFRSFVVKKIKEIEDEKHQSGKVINEANGEIKLEVEPKESEVVAGTTVDTQDEQIVNSSDHALSSLDEKQSDNPDNKENVTVDSVTTEQINCPALDDKEDSSAPAKKSKKHKHKHHHKHKSKKKKKRKKDDKKRDHSRSRSKSQMSLKSDSDLKLQPQSQSHSKSPVHTESSSRENENSSPLMESSNTGSNKNKNEAIDVNAVVPIGIEKECSLAEIKPLPQDNCNIDQHAKENSAVDTNNGIESATTGNASELLAAVSACEQDQASRLSLDRSSDNVQSKSTQTVEEKNKHDRPEERKTKRSRSRSHSKSTKHHKSQLHSHSQHSPVRKSSASSSSRRHSSRSSCSRKRPSPARHRSKSTSRGRKKHTESSPKSKRKASRSRSIAKKEQRSKSKSRSPLRIRHKSRSSSIARSKCQSKSKPRHCSRSGSRSKRRSRTRSGSPRRSKSRVKRSPSPRPRSRSNDRVCHRSASRGYLSRLVRTRRSPDWRRRSRSPLRRKSTSRTPERLTDLDKAQLLEIAKANAAAMCAKAGMPLPANLKPVVPLVKKVITKKMGCSSIQELTEKCKKIVESNDDNELGNKPHVSEEDEPFSNQPIKVNELKPISFSLNNPVFKPLSSHPQ